MEQINITETEKQIHVSNACINGSRFTNTSADHLQMENVSLQHVKIKDANLSDLEIVDAQLGGAYIHGIGMPPEGHPAYDPEAKQRPLRFEDCNLEGSLISDCNLASVQIKDCNLQGMTINSIAVTDLLGLYEKWHKEKSES